MCIRDRDQTHQMIIVGGGNIGRAMARSDSFPRNGFETIAIFDRDEKKIGREVDGLFVQDIDCMERFVREHPVDIALLAVPARAAQGLAERLYACGVRGFWNFAPVDLYLPENAVVENVHLDESLEVLSFRILDVYKRQRNLLMWSLRRTLPAVKQLPPRSLITKPLPAL